MSRSSATGEADVIVSLTSHGARISSAHLAIESVARGSVRPRRIILWLDDAAVLADPPAPLLRLRRRGLELRPTQDLGPHKKYFPALGEAIGDDVSALVTIDDDALYPRRWLERTVRALELEPVSVVAHRARRVRLEHDTDTFAPWAEWSVCASTAPSVLHVGIGEAGIAYPRPVLDALQARGTTFLAVAPRADDLWLHATALAIGVPTRQVSPRPLHPLITPGSQRTALAHANVVGGGNDAALSAAYTPADVSRLRAALTRESTP